MPPKNKRNPLVPPSTPPVRSSVSSAWAWTSLIWMAAVLYFYWQHFPWIATPPTFPPLASAPTQWGVFGQDAKALFLLATCVLGSTALGSYLLRFFRLSGLSSLEEKVFSMGLGLGAVGYILFTLGILQLYRPVVFWGLWAAGLGLAWMRWFRGRGLQSVNEWVLRVNRWHSDHVTWWLQVAMLWFVLAVACVMAFVPEIFYDAMVYHLGVPNWYLHEGGIKYYPSFHSQFPFLRQMLNVWGLALSGERLAKLLHASSAPLMIATYYVLAKRYSYPKTGLIAALALFSMPMVNLNLWTTGIDVGLSSFALLAFLAWLNGLNDTVLRGRWFTLAGVLGGFCFSSKYPGLIIVACLCLTTFLWLGIMEKNWKAAVYESARIGMVALGVTLPWLLKSWAFTGNPVYPYLTNVFTSRDLFPDRALDFLSDTQTGAKKEFLGLLISPWSQTLTNISSFSAPGIFLLGLLGFLTVGLIRKDVRHPGFVASAFFFGLYWFIINAMTDRIRLGIPGIAVGCFLLAHPIGYFYHRGGKALQTAIAVLVALSTFTGILSMLPTIAQSYSPLDVIAGRESAETYLSYTHPGMDPYPATNLFVEAKKIMPAGHRLLIIGDEKTSPCPVPFLASGVHNNSLIVQWSRESQNVEDLIRKFKVNKVSHMMINLAEAQRLSGYKILNWDERSLGIYCAFFEKHLRLTKQAFVVERFFKQSSPLLLYEFSAEPLTTPPSDNFLLVMYEDFRVAASDPNVAQKRADILQAVDHAFPGLVSVGSRLSYWKSQQRSPHAP